MNTRYDELKSLLLSGPIEAKRATYTCIHVDPLCVIFGPTSGTHKVMFPTDLLLEYIAALSLKVITTVMDPRTMRDHVKGLSDWASFHHGFETHVHAVVTAWETRYGSNAT